MARAKDAYHHGDLRNALVAQAVSLVEREGEAMLDFTVVGVCHATHAVER